MPKYDLSLRIKKPYRNDAKHFLEFLNGVGRRYPVKLAYSSTTEGRFHIALDGTPGTKIDALLQELVLNKGLFYYFVSLKRPQKQLALRGAILPIFQALIESRFRIPYTRFLRRHILGRLRQDSYVPGDLMEPSAHGYEILFRKWDIGIIDNWNFVKDADSLITNFLLRQSGHIPGARSPHFPALLKQACVKGIAADRELRKDFTQIHEARTGGLHRLASSINAEQLSSVAMRLYIYFEYFDEFCDSQDQKSERLHGKLYKRIRYGDEKGQYIEGVNWDEITKRPCHDCFALAGQFHHQGCDVEQCPRCSWQHLGCGCELRSDFE